MAETVYLNDGTMECIFDDKDIFLERLIREKLGEDAARCFRSFADEMIKEAKDWEAQASGNEQTADGYLQMCNNAKDALAEIITELNADRLNRQKLRTLAVSAFNELFKNL